MINTTFQTNDPLGFVVANHGHPNKLHIAFFPTRNWHTWPASFSRSWNVTRWTFLVVGLVIEAKLLASCSSRGMDQNLHETAGFAFLSTHWTHSDVREIMRSPNHWILPLRALFLRLTEDMNTSQSIRSTPVGDSEVSRSFKMFQAFPQMYWLHYA